MKLRIAEFCLQQSVRLPGWLYDRVACSPTRADDKLHWLPVDQQMPFKLSQCIMYISFVKLQLFIFNLGVFRISTTPCVCHVCIPDEAPPLHTNVSSPGGRYTAQCGVQGEDTPFHIVSVKFHHSVSVSRISIALLVYIQGSRMYSILEELFFL